MDYVKEFFGFGGGEEEAAGPQAAAGGGGGAQDLLAQIVKNTAETNLLLGRGEGAPNPLMPQQRGAAAPVGGRVG
jgi:hypothetical protein